MSIFNRKTRISDEKLEKALEGGDYGIHFPWISFGFLFAGVISEVTDGILMFDVIGKYVTDVGDIGPAVISAVTATICFASMAAIGYQSANKKVKYNTKKIEIAIWLTVGFFIAFLRVFKATNASTHNEEVYANNIRSAVSMGTLQLLLYLGSGLMTYSASKQLTNGKLYEYLMAQHKFNKLEKELSRKRERISGGINDLSVYPEYVDRLKASKDEVLKNVGQYNKATRAMCEAKMSIETDPDQMDVMYEDAKIKETKEGRKWATA